jgi:hypothetical protein
VVKGETFVRKCYQLQTTYDYYIQCIAVRGYDILEESIHEPNNQKPKPLKMKIMPANQRRVTRGIAEIPSCGLPGAGIEDQLTNYEEKTMTHQDAGHYRAKHPIDTELDPKIAEAITQKTTDGRITCAAAHKTAAKLYVSPADVGVAIDLLEIRIKKCQLGLFGYGAQKNAVKPAQRVSPELQDAIKASLVNNRISCLSCWEIAERFGIDRIDISAACEALHVRISSCQLGAFQ